MTKAIYKAIIKKLKTSKQLLDAFKKEVLKEMSRKEIASSFSQRNALSKNTPIYPNDLRADNDIAFGILTNGKFVSALDVSTEIEKGFVSHSMILYALGYAKNEHDPRPSVDYKVRGIVKEKMNNDIIFWESEKDLTQSASNWKAMQKCLEYLKSKGSIHSHNYVYASGGKAPLGKIGELI